MKTIKSIFGKDTVEAFIYISITILLSLITLIDKLIN